MVNQVVGYTAVYDPETGRIEQKEIVVSVETDVISEEQAAEILA